MTAPATPTTTKPREKEMSAETKAVAGGCYCGKVRYRASRVSTEVTECHCSQCRKQAGHRYATTEANAGDVEIDGADNITWFRSSSGAERGFCSICGSTLFWQSLNDDEMAILAASIDESTGLRITSHIFVDSKGDYYDINDGLPQFTGYDTPYSTS
jgi:hypothetical protein